MKTKINQVSKLRSVLFATVAKLDMLLDPDVCSHVGVTSIQILRDEAAETLNNTKDLSAGIRSEAERLAAAEVELIYQTAKYEAMRHQLRQLHGQIGLLNDDEILDFINIILKEN